MKIHDFNIENFPMDHRYEQPFLKMATERYLSWRIPDSRVDNNIGKIDKNPVPSIYVPALTYNVLLKGGNQQYPFREISCNFQGR